MPLDIHLGEREGDGPFESGHHHLSNVAPRHRRQPQVSDKGDIEREGGDKPGPPCVKLSQERWCTGARNLASGTNLAHLLRIGTPPGHDLAPLKHNGANSPALDVYGEGAPADHQAELREQIADGASDPYGR